MRKPTVFTLGVHEASVAASMNVYGPGSVVLEQTESLVVDTRAAMKRLLQAIVKLCFRPVGVFARCAQDRICCPWRKPKAYRVNG